MWELSKIYAPIGETTATGKARTIRISISLVESAIKCILWKKICSKKRVGYPLSRDPPGRFLALLCAFELLMLTIRPSLQESDYVAY